MSFPNFSGSSRRPRNVNLSGQKNLNPFALSGTSFTPSAVSSTSKTVAEAAAERRRRQQERDKLKAAENIQRAWRGHSVRQGLREQRRVQLDALYAEDASQSSPGLRSSQALPLVVTTLDPSRPADRGRLERFAKDLEDSSGAALRSANTSQITKLAHQLLAIPSSSTNQIPRSIFSTLIAILEINYDAAQDSLDHLYSVLGKYCQNGDIKDTESLGLLERAILTPIAKDAGARASRSFALYFLPLPNLDLFEGNVPAFANKVDVEKVSAAIVEAYTTGWAVSQTAEARLWLLAHFIALGSAKQHTSLAPSYLNAMYIQLSSVHAELKRHHIGQGPLSSDATDAPREKAPAFIERAVESLVARDEISHIMERFTANSGGSSHKEDNEASLLAAYILTLIRCFPYRGDDIRMKLYLADVQSTSNHPSSVKFFWHAMTGTNIFRLISSDGESNTLALLQRRNLQQLSSVKDDVTWDREWRAIFLFLELYVFVLRLTDDEDFASPWSSVSGLQTTSTTRLRQCMLSKKELEGLTLFLRNLAFTLYHNANDLQQHNTASRAKGSTTVTGLSISSVVAKARTQETYSVIPGIHYDSFRSTISTAMRMIYERDSRRSFLPDGHWLMVSRFDMSNFMDAVVAEAAHQREMAENGSDSDSDVDMDTDEDAKEVTAWSFSGHTTQALRIERMQLARKRELRKLQLAAVGPKLEVLRNMPFIIPFDVRVQIFRKLVTLDKVRRRGGMVDPDQWRMHVLHTSGTPTDPARGRTILLRNSATVGRGRVFQDAFAKFWELDEGLKEPIQITFRDKFNIEEAGIDGGGVTKEFLESVTQEAFAEDMNLFVANSQNALYPNPYSLDQLEHQLRETGLTPGSEDWRQQASELMAHYEFLGRIIGKCLYEGILIDVVFAGFFLLKWAASASEAGYRTNINDLREFDEELHNGMMRLKNYPGDVSELGLVFTIEDQISLANEPTRVITRNLIPNGDNIPVTNENKLLYINYVARHRLVAQPGRVTQNFLLGLGLIIEPAWLSMFNQSELQRLVGGDSSEIDVEDLRENTAYSGVYAIGDDGVEHPTIQMFWSVMHDLEDAQRRDVLKYVTSTPRAPLLGFNQLKPRFSIRDGGSDTTRLPSASTCVNLLKLPIYKDAKVLREKLLYAVSSGAGFDLS